MRAAHQAKKKKNLIAPATHALTVAPANTKLLRNHHPRLLAAAAVAKYKEAPELTELVKAGKLPPVEQRLPKEPEAGQ